MNWKVLILSSTVNAGNVKETRGNIEYQKNYFNPQKKLQCTSFLSSSGSCDDGKRNGIYKFY